MITMQYTDMESPYPDSDLHLRVQQAALASNSMIPNAVVLKQDFQRAGPDIPYDL
ncbi:hypothetical protein PM082_007955 [Marasmius tenuissimus]|nr:hypothetical protein PM082_007955 [Marasmius tenuissimus]